MLVRVTRVPVQVCDECDSLWAAETPVGLSGATNVEAYMRAIGRPGLWTELIIGELEQYLVRRERS